MISIGKETNHFRTRSLYPNDGSESRGKSKINTVAYIDNPDSQVPSGGIEKAEVPFRVKLDLQDPSPALNLRALWTLEKLGPDIISVVIPELLQILDDVNSPANLRMNVVDILGLTKSNANLVIPALNRALRDPSKYVQQSAVAAIDRIKRSQVST